MKALSGVLVKGGRITVERATAIITSLLDGRWLRDEATASAQLAELGFPVRPGTETELSPGLIQWELEATTGIEQPSLSSLEGKPTTVNFFVGSSPEPESATTRSAYEALIASLDLTLGAPERVWPDQPTPILWRNGDLDVGMQLFDRRDASVVMVWIEHRLRNRDAETRAQADEGADRGSRSP
jgi:hypothetical protein